MKTELSIIIFCLVGLMVFAPGCSQKIYDRITLTVDPNGIVTLECVHLGATSIATDTNLDGLAIKSDRGAIAVHKATVTEDRIKAIIPAVGIIETR